LLSKDGFQDIVFDDEAHDAAFVVKAKLSKESESFPTEVSRQELDSCFDACKEMADYWQGLLDRIRKFEKDEVNGAPVAIYGAGFYGNLIASSLVEFDNNVRCFVDQNRFLHGTSINDRPVLSPEEIPEEVTHVFVGLNPRIAKENIESIECWKSRQLNYFYL